jgi:hypothetical protein
MKYVVMGLNGQESIFLFPRHVDHDRFVEGIEAIRFGSIYDWERKFRSEGELLSAGFVTNGRCHGRSETLDLDSRSDVDTELLKVSFQ